jgi:hypothetical protein
VLCAVFLVIGIWDLGFEIFSSHPLHPSRLICLIDLVPAMPRWAFRVEIQQKHGVFVYQQPTLTIVQAWKPTLQKTRAFSR